MRGWLQGLLSMGPPPPPPAPCHDSWPHPPHGWLQGLLSVGTLAERLLDLLTLLMEGTTPGIEDIMAVREVR